MLYFDLLGEAWSAFIKTRSVAWRRIPTYIISKVEKHLVVRYVRMHALCMYAYRILGSISTRTSIRKVCIFCRSSSMGTSIHGVLYNETEMTARNIHFLIMLMFIINN